MTSTTKVVVVGLGEVGKPLFDLISRHHKAIPVDISPVDTTEVIDVMHVCYPFRIEDFVGETARYINQFKPELTIINSTVGVGTTRQIAERTGVKVVNSPVRGKHVRMLEDLQHYTKFVGAIEPEVGRQAAQHFESLGLKTKILPSPETTELAKLTETTYFGLLIAWAQELERYCDRADLDFDDIVSFYEEIAFFPPVKYFPGIIGGHCVMPNIKILSEFDHSQILDAIRNSNRLKTERETRMSAAMETAAAEH